jgi:putative pyruvate formate lyase activating enzyme
VGSGQSSDSELVVDDDVEPSYLKLDDKQLARRVEAALDRLSDCHGCPRHCGINRLAGETKFCKTGRHALGSGAEPHFGEEDPLRGSRGSGTIFFQRCNLGCVFCQNWHTSQRRGGQELDADAIAGLMIGLQDRGCHNLNLVTPAHVVPQLVEAIVVAIKRGLRLPIVYNTSAYDALSSLRLLDGIVDIYMPDFKLWDPESARQLLQAEDYPLQARAAIVEMQRQVGVLKLDRHGLARRGLLIRHLVMPGKLAETAAIMGWIAQELSPDSYVNLMAQYRPDNDVGQPGGPGESQHGEINRRPSKAELEEAYRAARAAGLWRFDQRRPVDFMTNEPL